MDYDGVKKPKWLSLYDELIVSLLQTALVELDPRQTQAAGDLDLLAIPYLAVLHLIHCMQASDEANRRGWHAAAICLARQCVEALTLVDAGCQDFAYAGELLAGWKAEKITQGQIRARLEKDVWARYGHGLWDESWKEFFANLASAVQPYSHYTPRLMGWQFAYLDHKAASDRQKWVMFGPNTYDRLKASRITLLLSLILWTLGRLLVTNNRARSLSHKLEEFGTALGSSNMLFKKADWGSQLLPDMFFKAEDGWRDE
jgi:hypothetical protein